jgi:nucleoside-diphosphate-sugar epimerase
MRLMSEEPVREGKLVILVLGASGAVGSALVDELHDGGHAVRAAYHSRQQTARAVDSGQDLVELQRHQDRVTSEPVPLIAVSRSGTATNRADAAFSPEDLLEAW